MPPERGTYRGIYSCLVDDINFQRLSPLARLVFLTMRIMREVGPGCIWRYYAGPVCSRTGLTEEQVEACLVELESATDEWGERAPWVAREGPIVWLRNGLRYDPTIKLNNLCHRNGVIRSLNELPKLQIVIDYCNYYNLPKPFESPCQSPAEAPWVPLTNYPPAPPPSPSPSPSPRPNKASDKDTQFYDRKRVIRYPPARRALAARAPASGGNGRETEPDPYAHYNEAWSCSACGAVHESRLGEAHVCPGGVAGKADGNGDH